MDTLQLTKAPVVGLESDRDHILGRWCRNTPNFMLRRADGPDPTERGTSMTLSFRSTVASTLVRALAYAVIATPASAHTYEYCRTDPESFSQSWGFSALATCQVTSSGIGSDWYRDPRVGDASGAHADATSRAPARTAPSRN